ncbi:MAG: hypothetical protein QOC92_757 [Acidimicrobiaceae bacterium]|jgi:hypothetical protein
MATTFSPSSRNTDAVRFQLEQRINGPVDSVAEAFVDPGFYELLAALPNLARPELLGREEKGAVVRMRVRYRFTGQLSAAVRAAIDPQKLSWVEEADHDLGAHHVTFRMIADHYADRFRCSGTYRFEPAGDAVTIRNCTGDIQIRMPLVGRRVETAIVSGVREHLNAEVELVERFIADQAG